ncbi:cytochrome c nitrite reductase pentaheme subunit [Vibrio sp. SCSIO 43136]|uniref:cytochrome c nitrite reductase pentaheme subunit n=1 Tax=Vibrio sp. SCSIO 43136 TaxID=2819101 RepID=UPI0020765A60|nr:cytochrome c nitrite reductase pentaheme subunit [Vibrio sp. SCSIO 43136]USD66382.1 cytochrome c nitrite reductase pentaheme subunit [Vibrio sp. SCSIO 43136]
MGNIKLTIATMLKSLLVICAFGLSINNVAADATDSGAQADSTRHKVELIRDPDYKCTQCHKDAKQTLFGSHGEDAQAILGREVNCTECHNNIGPNHREGAPDITKHSAAQSQAGSNKQLLSHSQILSANTQCTDCHQPEYLREDSWTHDVHATNLTCSNCHVVHGEKEGVLNKDRKGKIKMCVDCHSDITKLKALQEGK